MESVADVGAPRGVLTFDPILDPTRDLLTVPRPAPPAVGEMMEGVLGGDVFEHEAQVEVARPDCSSLVREVQSAQARRYLSSDIADLVKAFGLVMGTRRLCVGLSLVADDMCQKLHTDNVSIRLLCTYAGPGTQWVANEDVVRANLGRTDVDVETANRSVLRTATALRRCSPGEVILLKGEAFPGNADRGAVHRSPPIRSLGLRRLLLKIDEYSLRED